jgi:hypothetical protein
MHAKFFPSSILMFITTRAVQFQKKKTSPMCLPTEKVVLESVNAISSKPQKETAIKIIMRRAPTQKFFRGSLSRNPVSASMLAETIWRVQPRLVTPMPDRQLRIYGAYCRRFANVGQC